MCAVPGCSRSVITISLLRFPSTNGAWALTGGFVRQFVTTAIRARTIIAVSTRPTIANLTPFQMGGRATTACTVTERIHVMAPEVAATIPVTPAIAIFPTVTVPTVATKQRRTAQGRNPVVLPAAMALTVTERIHATVRVTARTTRAIRARRVSYA